MSHLNEPYVVNDNYVGNDNDDAVINDIFLEGRSSRLRDIAKAWYESAKFHHVNETYYKTICEEIGKLIGKEAFTDDVGGVHEDVFACKLPGLVKKLVEAKEEYELDTSMRF